MKLIFSFLVFIVIAISSFGQPVINPISQEESAMRNLAAAKDSGWFFKMSATVNTTQTYLKNWAAGGNSSLNITGLFNGCSTTDTRKLRGIMCSIWHTEEVL